MCLWLHTSLSLAFPPSLLCTENHMIPSWRVGRADAALQPFRGVLGISLTVFVYGADLVISVNRTSVLAKACYWLLGWQTRQQTYCKSSSHPAVLLGFCCNRKLWSSQHRIDDRKPKVDSPNPDEQPGCWEAAALVNEHSAWSWGSTSLLIKMREFVFLH